MMKDNSHIWGKKSALVTSVFLTGFCLILNFPLAFNGFHSSRFKTKAEGDVAMTVCA